jgi:NAD-dependent SIR2 family protein deacetylase
LIEQKLLIVLGAGASVEFGMPSVSEVDKLFDKWCSDRYIAVDTNQSYYKYLMEVSQKEHNFESGIYLLWQLAKLYNESDLKKKKTEIKNWKH